MNGHATNGHAMNAHAMNAHPINTNTTSAMCAGRERGMTRETTTGSLKAQWTSLMLGAALAALGALGCAGTPEPPSSTSTETQRSPAVTLSADAQRIYKRTLVRDGVPPCAELTADVASPVPALLEIAERVTAPPSSGMRAATCLLEGHALEVEPTLTSWVTHESTLGFGLLVLGHLDELDPALGDRLARAALAGELADRARSRIARSERHHGRLEGETPGTTTH
jgi:hypothetical protein